MDKKPLLGDLHPSLQLIFCLLVAFISLFVVVLVGVLLAVPFLGSDVLKMLSGELNPVLQPGLAKYTQALSHLGLFIVPSVLLSWFFGRRLWHYLYAQSRPHLSLLLISALVIFATVPLINYTLEMNMRMHLPESLSWLENWMRAAEDSAERLTRMFLSVNTWQGLLVNILVIAVIPAIGEEFIFRGVLMRIFKKWTGSYHLAVWITAILFSAMHLQFFGFLPRMLLGLLLGYMLVWSGSMWVPVFAHFVNNAAAIIYYYLFTQNVTDDTFEHIGKDMGDIQWVLLSIALVSFLMWWLKGRGRPLNAA